LQEHDNPNRTVLPFFGDGTGRLLAQDALIVGAEPHTVIATDLNKDGNIDLAVTNRVDATVSVLLGNGSGTFKVFTTVSVVSVLNATSTPLQDPH